MSCDSGMEFVLVLGIKRSWISFVATNSIVLTVKKYLLQEEILQRIVKVARFRQQAIQTFDTSTSSLSTLSSSK